MMDFTGLNTTMNTPTFEVAKEYVLKNDCINYVKYKCSEPYLFMFFCVILGALCFWLVYERNKLRKKLDYHEKHGKQAKDLNKKK